LGHGIDRHGDETIQDGRGLMIIAVDIREWQPERRTGIGRALEEFLRVAAATRPSDRFLLLGNSTSEVRIQADNVAVIRAPERWTPWWDQVTLPKLLLQHGADVLYSPYIKVPLWAPVPVLSTIHDLTFFVRPDHRASQSEMFLNPPFRLFCRLVVRRASAVFVDSVTSAQDARRHLNVDPAKLRVVPLATSPSFMNKAASHIDEEVRRRYRLSSGYLLYVGAFWPHKNIQRLLRVYATLPESLRAMHPLILVGGPMTPDLDAALTSLPADDIRWVGLIPDADLPALYRGAALFVFPSHYEGFGLPVLEAMASGVPVLCSTAPALTELTGDAAAHADPSDDGAWRSALRALLQDPERRNRHAAQGLARAAAFSPERMTGHILKVIDEVAGREREHRFAHDNV
jgi:glycosyltransferase involved in cell wall biosynthesis